ncbi:MAG: DUF4091 domain-containing protein [Acidobacteria bacterium]|nr:DUF4091 domain-containing protein [Acidobacteriota bacterium]
MRRWLIIALIALPLLCAAFIPSSPSLIWWTTHALDKVGPYQPPPETAAVSVQLSAARNEFESFQLVLRAIDQNISNIDLEMSDLLGDEGAVLSRENATVYLEKFVDLSKPSSIAGSTGEWPDPLVPKIDRYAAERRNAFPFELSNRRNQPIWIELYIPLSTRPGKYRGNLTALINKRADIVVPVEIEVWNFALPSTSSFTTTFGFSGIAALHQHFNGYTTDDDLYALTYLYRKAALWHRLSIHGGSMSPPGFRFAGEGLQMDWTKIDAEVGPFLDGTVFDHDEPLFGAKATSVEIRPADKLKSDEALVLFWREYARHFREKGWFDRLFHYLWDEPTADNQELVRRGRLLHEADPELKNLVTFPLNPAWIGVIDVWVPLLNCFLDKPEFPQFCSTTVSRDAYAREIARKRMLWWYQSCASHGCSFVGREYFRGWPTYVIDASSVSNRIMPWMAWKYDIRGELYYNINEPAGKPYDPWRNVSRFGGNGDGVFVYPGRPNVIGGRTHIPIESIRLKLIRDGLEDYEYLTLLSRSAGTGAASVFLDKLIVNLYTYETDTGEFYSVRYKLGQELQRRYDNASFN